MVVRAEGRRPGAAGLAWPLLVLMALRGEGAKGPVRLVNHEGRAQKRGKKTILKSKGMGCKNQQDEIFGPSSVVLAGVGEACLFSVLVVGCSVLGNDNVEEKAI